MKSLWVEHYEHCEQCNKATEVRSAEATDIYDPVGGAKMLRNCCDEGRRLCREAEERYKKTFPDDSWTIY